MSRVLIIGDVMLDEYCHVKVERISPEAPVPIALVRAFDYRPGGAANVAANIEALGGKPTVISVVGEEKAFHQVLYNDRWNLRYVTDETRRTTIKTRIVSTDGQQLLRVDVEDQSYISKDIEHAVCEQIMEAIELCDVVVLSDYAKGVLTDKVIVLAIRMARARNIPVIVDPKRVDLFDYDGATIITPNEMEFKRSGGTPDGSAILVTLGERGMELREPSGNVARIEADTQEVVDVTGAGDTVVAVLAMLIKKHSLHQAAFVANKAAGIVVRKRGTSVVRPSELEVDYFRSAPREGLGTVA